MKGRHGNGCKCKNVRESIVLQEISDQMGWNWNGTEEFPVEQFRRTVKRAEVRDGKVHVVGM
jgi:hypothetical protein